jgi:mycofactocin precursor
MADDTVVVIEQADESVAAESAEGLVEDVLVEEISIDGMCGVY